MNGMLGWLKFNRLCMEICKAPTLYVIKIKRFHLESTRVNGNGLQQTAKDAMPLATINPELLIYGTDAEFVSIPTQFDVMRLSAGSEALSGICFAMSDFFYRCGCDVEVYKKAVLEKENVRQIHAIQSKYMAINASAVKYLDFMGRVELACAIRSVFFDFEREDFFDCLRVESWKFTMATKVAQFCCLNAGCYLISIEATKRHAVLIETIFADGQAGVFLIYDCNFGCIRIARGERIKDQFYHVLFRYFEVFQDLYDIPNPSRCYLFKIKDIKEKHRLRSFYLDGQITTAI